MTEDDAWPMYLQGAPRPEGLSPLGRFTDMGLRARADFANAASMARERGALKRIMEAIRRSTNPQGMVETQLPGPGNAVVTQAQSPIEDFGNPSAPIPDMTLTSQYGTGSSTFAPRTEEATFEGMPASEWFQRAANAGGANKFAQPEPGYQGVPFYPQGSPGYSSWEAATAKFRKPRPKG